MFALFGIMLDVIAPIMLVAGIAFMLGRIYDPDPRPLSIYLIYLFTPALVFRGIYTTELPGGEIIGIGVVVIGVALVMMMIGYAAARVFRFDARSEGALILSVVLVNAANYGIPLNTFAFGEEGGNIAIVYYVISALVGNTLGVYFASRGSVSVRDAAFNVLKVPIGYAAVIGLVMNVYEIELPLILERSIIDIAAPASIPMMLALLGLQLARASRNHGQSDDEKTLARDWRALALGVGLRLVAAPIVALMLARLVGLEGITFNVSVIESSMPTAVLASALATQFGSDAPYVSAVTLLNTIASVLTLSVLILLLGGTI